jgi:hypothetical protein
VAAFFSVSVLIVALSSGTLAGVVQEGTVLGTDHEGGATSGSAVDFVLIPFFRGILAVANLAQQFSPVSALSAGRSIPWVQLGQAFLRVVVLLGGILALLGITAFNRRELATTQANQ